MDISGSSIPDYFIIYIFDLNSAIEQKNKIIHCCRSFGLTLAQWGIGGWRKKVFMVSKLERCLT